VFTQKQALKQAREKKDSARSLIADEIDPSENRKAIKASKVESASNGFEIIARERGAKHVNDDATHKTVGLIFDMKHYTI
jgi:hypothetical protein